MIEQLCEMCVRICGRTARRALRTVRRALRTARRAIPTFVVIICAATFAASAKPVDFSNREIPALVTADNILTGSLDTRFAPAGRSLLVKPNLTPETAALPFGLLVPGKSETTVTINGRRINILPLERSDALVYRLGSRDLTVGENAIRVDRAEPGSWAGLTMFSIREGFEQVHFHQVFGEPSPRASVLSTRDFEPAPTQTDYDVKSYDCTWIPRTSSPYMEIGSEVTMTATALANINFVDIDFDLGGDGSMTIDYVDSGQATPALTWTEFASSSTPRIRVNLPGTVTAGLDFVIRIGFHGQPNTQFDKDLFGTVPLYASDHGSQNRPVVYNVSQAYQARRWWPCKDHPSDKADTTIQRIIVPDNLGYELTAVSNGVLQSEVDNGATRTYTWVNGHPIATYLMSMAISDYQYTGGQYTALDGVTQMPVGSYIYPEDFGFEGNAYLGTIEIMNFYADTFGEYPFLDQKYVTAAWNIGFAIEHQTATSMPGGETFGLDTDGLTRRNVHELAHQWFGDKVTTHDWDHLWLNEGFATYCEALFFGHKDGMAEYHRQMNVEINPDFFDPVVGPDSDEFNGGVVYNKGAWVLHMLRFTLGDEDFFQALRDYAAVGYTTAVSQPGDGAAPVNFQTVVEQSAGLTPGSMETYFTQWLRGSDDFGDGTTYAGRPAWSFSAAYDAVTDSVDVNLNQAQGKLPFEMPVEIRLTAADSSTTDVRVAAGPAQIQTNFPLDGFVPVSAELDPDNWVLNRLRASIFTSSLPDAVTGAVYSFVLQGDSGAGGVSNWQKLAGTPAWLSVNGNGQITGTPPFDGTYTVNVRMTDTDNVAIDASFDLKAVAGTPPPPVVINEVLYENNDGADSAEFVELRNNDSSAINIGNWQIVVVDSSGNAAVTVIIPGGTMLQPGEYYVAGNDATINAVYPGAVDLDTNWNETLPDGEPGAIILKMNDGTRVDSLAYRSDNNFGGGSQASMAFAEGGTGRAISADISNINSNATLGRLPDGVDTNSNLQDFAMIPPSPGGANSAGVTLPFFDDFNTAARPEWKPAFEGPVRVISPGQSGKPPVAAPSPAGGQALEVFDSTGGGDVVYLPGSFDKINMEGYLWIPPDTNDGAWSTGVGVATRVESAWFSSSEGFALQNGFYLEYQNGPDVNLHGFGGIADAPGQARLLAADASACPGVGVSATNVTSLGIPATPAVNSWQPFRISFDRPADHLFASIGGDVIYDGVIPTGGFNINGGITIGFRENHSNNPGSGEGTWVDNISVNLNTGTGAGVEDYFLYN